jgi:hypothetical protein
VSNITNIVANLLAQANMGTLGSDIFVFNAPDKVRNCLLVLDSLDGIERNEDLPGYKKANFSVIVRNVDYQSAVTIANQVVSVLDLSRLSVDGVLVQRMRATHDPIPFPVPDSDVIEVSVNLWAAFVEP